MSDWRVGICRIRGWGCKLETAAAAVAVDPEDRLMDRRFDCTVVHHTVVRPDVVLTMGAHDVLPPSPERSIPQPVQAIDKGIPMPHGQQQAKELQL